jgi:hypothetical protein
MTILETTAMILDDRRLVLQLPDNVSPGNHRLRIEIDPVTEPASIDLAGKGIDERQAADLRHRLGTFAEDWDRPEAGVYDERSTR